MKTKAILFAVVTGIIFFALLLLFVLAFWPEASPLLLFFWFLGAVAIMAIFTVAVREANFLLHQFFNSEYEKRSFREFHYPLWRSILFWPINLVFGAPALLLFILLGIFCLKEIWAELKNKKGVKKTVA